MKRHSFLQEAQNTKADNTFLYNEKSIGLFVRYLLFLYILTKAFYLAFKTEIPMGLF